MNYKKLVSAVFALLGVLLIAGTVLLSFRSLNASARLLRADEAAAQRTEEWMEAVCAGDYAAAGSIMYGQPELLTGNNGADEWQLLFWDAFVDSISYEFTGDCYATDAGLSRDLTITALDLPALMEPLKERMDALLPLRADEAEDQDAVFDENNNYRDAFVMDILMEAATQILAEEDPRASREITLNLIYEDGQWWIQTEQDLIDVLSGKMKN